MKQFQLMTLPYEVEALEPIISGVTIAFHYGKHLAAYVNNLNGLLSGSQFEDSALEKIVCKADGAILNNAGQILNHEMYFAQFAGKPAKNAPTSALAEAIVRDFGSFEAFKEEFQKKGVALFGSGWVWLSADNDGRLVITQETNAGSAPAVDFRRMGACLLPRLPKPPSRPPRRPLADSQLGYH